MRWGRAAHPGTLISRIYGDSVNERHRHRYEIDDEYVDRLLQAGLRIAARTPTEKLTETIEPTGKLWASLVRSIQFHPEVQESP